MLSGKSLTTEHYMTIVQDAIYRYQDAIRTVFSRINHKQDPIKKEGWVILDYPTTGEQAAAMIEGGILPDHVFFINGGMLY